MMQFTEGGNLVQSNCHCHNMYICIYNSLTSRPYVTVNFLMIPFCSFPGKAHSKEMSAG